jgi:hypothetical protein
VLAYVWTLSVNEVFHCMAISTEIAFSLSSPEKEMTSLCSGSLSFVRLMCRTKSLIPSE